MDAGEGGFLIAVARGRQNVEHCNSYHTHVEFSYHNQRLCSFLQRFSVLLSLLRFSFVQVFH